MIHTLESFVSELFLVLFWGLFLLFLVACAPTVHDRVEPDDYFTHSQDWREPSELGVQAWTI